MRTPVALYQVLVLSVLLSCAASWTIAHRYRRQMQRLMRAPGPGDSRPSNAHAADAAGDRPAGASVSLADNRAAGMRLTMLLIALSFLLSVTSACIWWALSFPGAPLPPKRVAVIAVLHLWPVFPALALMWRWSRKRLFGVLLLWRGVVFAILLWRQTEFRPLQALAMMAWEIGLTLALVSLVFLGKATRAIAP